MVTLTAPDAASVLINRAAVVAAAFDPDLTDNLAAEATTISSAQADLELEKMVEPALHEPGDPVRYSLLVTNHGPTTAESVSLVDQLPVGATLIGYAGDGWLCAVVGSDVVCDGPDLLPASESVLSLDIESPLVEGPVVNEAMVTAASDDPDPSNNSAQASSTSAELPPRITLFDSISGRGAIALNRLEPITRLVVGFDDQVVGADQDSAYLLVEAGDGGLETTSCAAGASPGDVTMVLEALLFDSDRRLAFLELSGGSLPAGEYRLLACADEIAGLDSSPLDGNGDGIGGDDYLGDFEVEADHLVVNPNLDEGLGVWAPTESHAGILSYENSVDAQGYLQASGAVRVSTGARGTVASIHQCIPIAEPGRHRVGLVARIQAPPPDQPEVLALVETFADADCSGSSIDVQLMALLAGDTGGQFVLADETFDVRDGGGSILLNLVVDGGDNANGFVADLDATRLFPDGTIFENGFESGGLGEWSDMFRP